MQSRASTSPLSAAVVLLRFHVRVGARLALQSSTLFFATLLALVMLNMDPPALVRALAAGLFGVPRSAPVYVGLAIIAYTLTAWAAPPMAYGLNGWIRHLAAGSLAHRRAMTAAMAAVLSPLILAIAALGWVAAGNGPASDPAVWVRIALILGAASVAAVPAVRQHLAIFCCLGSSAFACSDLAWGLAASALMLTAAELASGPLRTPRRRKRLWGSARLPLPIQIALRATGARIPAAYTKSLLVFGATILFVANNDLTGDLRLGTFRFGSLMALVALLSGTAADLTQRRPVWPWARSLPWSASRRVGEDCFFLGLVSLPLLALVAMVNPAALAAGLVALPLLTLRAASLMRHLPERQSGSLSFLAEGYVVASLSALLPWTFFLWIALSVPAFLLACREDRDLRATRWLRLRHSPTGDSLSWSDR